MDTKGLEESYITSALNRFRKDGFQTEQFKDKSFAALGPKFRAIYNYVQRGEKLAPGLKYETFESPSDFSVNQYSFSFRHKIFLYPGEVKRITHNQDIPHKFSGFMLKIRVSGIEFR